MVTFSLKGKRTFSYHQWRPLETNIVSYKFLSFTDVGNLLYLAYWLFVAALVAKMMSCLFCKEICKMIKHGQSDHTASFSDFEISYLVTPPSILLLNKFNRKVKKVEEIFGSLYIYIYLCI